MPLNFSLSCIAVRGPEAALFLQGQLCNDVEAITEGELQLSAWLSPAGRVISIIDVARTADEFLLFMPSDLAQSVSRRLGLYKLRAQLEIDDIEAASARLSDRPRSNARALGPAIFETLDRQTEPAASEEWAFARLRAGIPWINAANTEKYTAHQLNLDRLGGFSLNKGCYVGQEIVARTEHLGKVKRRASRWSLSSRTDQDWVQTELQQDGRSAGRIVSQASGPAHTEFLVLLAASIDETALTLPDGSALQRESLSTETQT